MEIFNPDKIFNKKNILSSCEGIRKNNSKIMLPNFHAIQYYVSDPKPQIVSKILDFGLTSRYFLESGLNFKENPKQIKKKIDKILRLSFYDMTEIVINFIFDLFLNGKLDYLYAGAVPHQFISNTENNQWRDFIQTSREFKLNNLKRSLYENFAKFLDFEISAIRDKELKSKYNKIKKDLKNKTNELDKIVLNHIKEVIENSEFIKDLYSSFFDPPVAENNYEGEIILTGIAA